jgi:hypothetical protein
MTIYTIEITSRGLDVGIGKITQEQYEYWSDEDREYDLGEALQSNFDYEENGTPEECKLYDYYNEYEDVLFTFGADFEYHNMTIKDDKGNIVYTGDISDLASEHDPEYELEMIDGGDRDYYMSVMEPGYYLEWCNGGKGVYFDGDFEAEEFDPKKLKFKRVETDFGEVLGGISYDGDHIDNNAGDYDIKSFEARVHYVE